MGIHEKNHCSKCEKKRGSEYKCIPHVSGQQDYEPMYCSTEDLCPNPTRDTICVKFYAILMFTLLTFYSPKMYCLNESGICTPRI